MLHCTAFPLRCPYPKTTCNLVTSDHIWVYYDRLSAYYLHKFTKDVESAKVTPKLHVPVSNKLYWPVFVLGWKSIACPFVCPTKDNKSPLHWMWCKIIAFSLHFPVPSSRCFSILLHVSSSRFLYYCALIFFHLILPALFTCPWTSPCLLSGQS